MQTLVKGKKFKLDGMAEPLVFADRSKNGSITGTGTTVEEVLKALIMHLREEGGKYAPQQEEHFVKAANELHQAYYYEQHKVEVMKEKKTEV